MVIEAFRLILGVPDDLVIFIQLLKVSTVYADMCSVVVETQSFIGNDVTLCTIGKKEKKLPATLVSTMLEGLIAHKNYLFS